MGQLTLGNMAFRTHPRFGYGYPAGVNLDLNGSSRLASDVANEEAAVQARRQLCADLAQAEQAENNAATQLAAHQQNTAQRVAEAQEQARRAAEAERIHAAAMEEYRVREAEAQRSAAAAAEAKAIFDRAEAAFKQAEAARNQEVAAAQKTAEVARAAEHQLAASATNENNTASTDSCAASCGWNPDLPLWIWLCQGLL